MIRCYAATPMCPLTGRQWCRRRRVIHPTNAPGATHRDSPRLCGRPHIALSRLVRQSHESQHQALAANNDAIGCQQRCYRPALHGAGPELVGPAGTTRRDPPRLRCNPAVTTSVVGQPNTTGCLSHCWPSPPSLPHQRGPLNSPYPPRPACHLKVCHYVGFSVLWMFPLICRR